MNTLLGLQPEPRFSYVKVPMVERLRDIIRLSTLIVLRE